VQRNAMKCWESGNDLKELLLADRDVMGAVNAKKLEEVFNIQTHFRDIDRTFKKLGLV